MRRKLLKAGLLCVVLLLLAGLGFLLVFDRAPSRERKTMRLASGGQADPGVEVEDLRRNGAGFAVGTLRRDTTIQGYPCARGWVHFYPTGALRSFTTTEPLPLGSDTIPPGTWVTLDSKGVLLRCNFPADKEIQGHLCNGTGGSKGVGTSFHPDGALESFYCPADTTIQGVNCVGGVLELIVLYEDGKLNEATLADDQVLGGRQCRKGDRVAWDKSGRVVSVTGPTLAERGLRRIFNWFN